MRGAGTFGFVPRRRGGVVAVAVTVTVTLTIGIAVVVAIAIVGGPKWWTTASVG